MTAHFKFALHIGSLITEVDGLRALLSIRSKLGKFITFNGLP